MNDLERAQKVRSLVEDPQRDQWELVFHHRDIMTEKPLRMGALRLDDIE